MKTYWDHTDEEREQLTTDQVETLLKYELMEAGVIVPPYPGDAPKKSDELPSKTVYGVKVSGPNYSGGTTLWFETSEAAEQAAALKPICVCYESSTGYNNEFADTPLQVEIVNQKVYDREQFTRLQSDLRSYIERKKEYDELLEKYNKAKTESSRATESVWEDWSERQSDLRARKRILEVYDDYLETCEGNEAMAARFLVKAYPDSECMDALKKDGRRWPIPEESALAEHTCSAGSERT